MTVLISRGPCKVQEPQSLPLGPNPASGGQVTIDGGSINLTMDNEYISSTFCNPATNTIWQSVTRFVDGAQQGAPTQTDLGVACTSTEQVTRSIETCCLIDDVNGDGSFLIPFVRANIIEINPDNTINSVPLGDYTTSKLEIAYTVQGTASDPSNVGSDVELKQGTATVNGGSWSPSPLTKSYTVRVASGTGATFTDSFGNTRTLEDGEVFTYSHEGIIFDSQPVVTADASTTVVITYTEMGSM